MPSAVPVETKKDEAQFTNETNDAIGHVRQAVQNKIRNLEKRKTKLDGYQAQLNAGKQLTEDQLSALSQLNVVEQSIETQKEFLKLVTTAQTDFAKQTKGQKKKEERERQVTYTNRLRDLLRFQDVLNSLGNDEVRQDFLDGAKGALKCTKEEMALYDDLFKKVCPASEDSSEWSKHLDESAHFTYHLVTGSPKTVPGHDPLTFAQLKESLDKMANWSYFSEKGAVINGAAAEKAAESHVPIDSSANNGENLSANQKHFIGQ